MELIKQETQERVSKEKEEHMKAHVMQKYGHSIELQMRKEMDMEIPELNVKTDISAHVSLKCPSPNINIMTPPSKGVQLKTASPSRISSVFSTPMLGGGTTAGAGKGMPAGKGMGAKPKQLLYPCWDTPVPIESNEYLKSQARVKVKKMEELDKILESSLPDSYAETILGSLQALGLRTDREVLEDLSKVPADSFFVQLSPYFPQCAKPGKSERSIAAQIRATLCDFVSSQGPNFVRVCFFMCLTFFISCV